MVKPVTLAIVEIVETPIRLLLVDDEVHVRKGLAMAFSAEPDLQVIGEADDGEGAVDLARQLHPDAVVMDVRMRRVDGLAATRMIRDVAAEVRVVVLSLMDDRVTRRAAAEADASAFVGKQEGSERLVSTIRSVARAS